MHAPKANPHVLPEQPREKRGRKHLPCQVWDRTKAGQCSVGVTVLLTMSQGWLRMVSCVGGLDACFNASNPRLHNAVSGLPLVGRNCPSSQRSRNGGVAVKPSTLAANLPKRTLALCVEEPFGLRLHASALLSCTIVRDLRQRGACRGLSSGTHGLRSSR